MADGNINIKSCFVEFVLVDDVFQVCNDIVVHLFVFL